MTPVDGERANPGPPGYGASPEERKRRARILTGADGNAPGGGTVVDPDIAAATGTRLDTGGRVGERRLPGAAGGRRTTGTEERRNPDT